MPWEGTPRLPFEMRQVLHVEGGIFADHPGYLNFTHAMRVLDLQPLHMTNFNAQPGQAYEKNLNDDLGILHSCVPDLKPPCRLLRG